MELIKKGVDYQEVKQQYINSESEEEKGINAQE
jgi:hypothetical protein